MPPQTDNPGESAGAIHDDSLPEAAKPLLAQILEGLAAGDHVTVVRTPAELSTFGAAKLLGMSRPTLIKLLDEGRIPHRMVGSHRRIRTADLLAYQAAELAARRAALDELVALSEELGLYPEP